MHVAPAKTTSALSWNNNGNTIGCFSFEGLFLFVPILLILGCSQKKKVRKKETKRTSPAPISVPPIPDAPVHDAPVPDASVSVAPKPRKPDKPPMKVEENPKIIAEKPVEVVRTEGRKDEELSDSSRSSTSCWAYEGVGGLFRRNPNYISNPDGSSSSRRPGRKNGSRRIMHRDHQETVSRKASLPLLQTQCESDRESEKKEMSTRREKSDDTSEGVPLVPLKGGPSYTEREEEKVEKRKNVSGKTTKSSRKKKRTSKEKVDEVNCSV